ncbi:MAG: tetratricopeptide repeat protein [Clostridia bacterium]|nr:tetratricopeptide repeat protein [Clostridia bacterium]
MAGISQEDYKEPQCLLNMSDPNSKEVRSIDISRVIDKLDSYLSKDDMPGAKRHLEYWLREAESGNDERGRFSILNELMGLCRKMKLEKEAKNYAMAALEQAEAIGIKDTISYGTCLLNVATVYKAFGDSEKALGFYEKAKENYGKNLPSDDRRAAGLCNNMGLALCDVKRYEDSIRSYEKALEILKKYDDSRPDRAITWLNLANAYEAKDGLLEAEESISKCLDEAEKELLSEENVRDGYYAFVCEKCAPTFGYYGRFGLQNDLLACSAEIYEENRKKGE